MMHADMGTEAARRALEDETNGTVPDGVAQLSDDEMLHLAGLIRTARHRQAQALEEAGDRALGRIPRLLRGPIRKVVG